MKKHITLYTTLIVLLTIMTPFAVRQMRSDIIAWAVEQPEAIEHGYTKAERDRIADLMPNLGEK